VSCQTLLLLLLLLLLFGVLLWLLALQQDQEQLLCLRVWQQRCLSDAPASGKVDMALPGAVQVAEQFMNPACCRLSDQISLDVDIHRSQHLQALAPVTHN
jgi:hypothetical protein